MPPGRSTSDDGRDGGAHGVRAGFEDPDVAAGHRRGRRAGSGRRGRGRRSSTTRSTASFPTRPSRSNRSSTRSAATTYAPAVPSISRASAGRSLPSSRRRNSARRAKATRVPRVGTAPRRLARHHRRREVPLRRRARRWRPLDRHPTRQGSPASVSSAAPPNSPRPPMGGGRGAGTEGPIAPRSDFRTLAAWFPSVRTGPDGTASLGTVAFGDSLTRWRITSRTVDADDPRRHRDDDRPNVEERAHARDAPALPARRRPRRGAVDDPQPALGRRRGIVGRVGLRGCARRSARRERPAARRRAPHRDAFASRRARRGRERLGRVARGHLLRRRAAGAPGPPAGHHAGDRVVGPFGRRTDHARAPLAASFGRSCQRTPRDPRRALGGPGRRSGPPVPARLPLWLHGADDESPGPGRGREARPGTPSA